MFSGSSSVFTGPPLCSLGQPAKLWAMNRRGSGLDSGLDEAIGGLGAKPVGLGEGLGEAPEIEIAGQCGHLVDDDLRLGFEDRSSHCLTIPAVEHHRAGAGETQAVGLGRGPGGPNHLVTGIDQQRHQTLPDGPGGAGYEDSHVVSFRLPYPGRDGGGFCDNTRSAVTIEGTNSSQATCRTFPIRGQTKPTFRFARCSSRSPTG